MTPASLPGSRKWSPTVTARTNTVAVTAAPPVTLLAPLGGYRRAQKVTPRPAAEQDGYVFGYGQDYRRGRRDLATLTGPTKLPPNWAHALTLCLRGPR